MDICGRAYKSDRGIPREDIPIALLASLFIYVFTGASLMAQLVKNPSAVEETWV